MRFSTLLIAFTLPLSTLSVLLRPDIVTFDEVKLGIVDTAAALADVLTIELQAQDLPGLRTVSQVLAPLQFLLSSPELAHASDAIQKGISPAYDEYVDAR